ncbi:MAG: hypothetical protein O7B81_07110 [Gammaproteobacteria bacterium]|nr:hypothetical protein [Gammaproteobacteria bacterium]
MKIGNQDIMHPAHDRVWEMLPWYYNDTVDPSRRGEVETHLGECLVCGREIRRLERLFEAVAAPAEEHACAQAYLRLSDRIHAGERVPQMWTGKLLAGLRTIFEPAPFIAGASVLVFSSILVAVIVVGGDAKLASVEQPFQTLGHQEKVSAPLSHPLFRIVLEGEPNAAGLDDWLKRHDAELINGPSVIGVLTVKIAMGRRSFETVLNEIRADGETIFVEPVDLIGARPDRRR